MKIERSNIEYCRLKERLAFMLIKEKLHAAIKFLTFVGVSKVVVHIGFPKAGSSFLQQYFSAHPGIHYSGDLVGDYKSSGVLHQIQLDSKADLTVISEEQLSVWQGHLDIVGVRFKAFDIPQKQREVCESLFQQFPQAKILIVTRGFEDVVRSMYSQYISIGGLHTLAGFQKEFGHILSSFYDYDFIIDTYISYFGKSNVVVMPFELLKHNAELFLREMEKSLEIPQFSGEQATVNSSLEEGEIRSYRRLSNALYRIIAPLPYTLKKMIYGLYVYLLYTRKLSGLSKVLPTEAEDLKVDNEALLLFSGKSSILEDYKQFAPYLDAYRVGKV